MISYVKDILYYTIVCYIKDSIGFVCGRHPHAKKCKQPPEAIKDKETDFILEPPEGVCSC